MKNRGQRVNINATFSTCTDLISGVPQGSMKGPLYFNIHLNDLFFFLQEINICVFTDQTTPFVCDERLVTVLDKFQRNSELANYWFESSYAKLSTNKYHLLVSEKKRINVDGEK